MASILVTPAAVEEFKRIIAEQGLPQGTAIRISVVGGGCSGFEYRLEFAQNPNPGEDVVEQFDGVAVVVDRKSLRFLNGTTVDYQKTLMQRGFVFHNPLAVRTCGCGSSFSL